MFTYLGEHDADARQVKIWSLIAAALIVIVGGVFIGWWPSNADLWQRVKDAGPAIAGSWVLCAALFSLTAASITADEARNDANKRHDDRLIGISMSVWAKSKRSGIARIG